MEKLSVVESKEASIERGKASESRRAYWYNLLKEFERSGLAQKQFAELHGVKSTRLSKWRSYFKKLKNKSSEKGLLSQAKESVELVEPINFLSLELSEGIEVEKKLLDKIVFRHESGFTLELEARSNKELFRSGLLMLMEIVRC